MKIIVYAICKNEEKFAARWAVSMGEADGIYVLDTGSTDKTAEILREKGAHVTEEIISPWRFDAARNASLELVPEDADICVCTDLDEVFHPGWRTALERSWQPGTTRASYRYTWNFESDGREGHVFWLDKIHCRRGYRWTHPVHEVLTWQGDGEEKRVTAEGVQLDHHPDPEKSRAQYLPLLELAVRESPEDDRNIHYLGREYLYYGRWDDCIATLMRHLRLPTATWADERCASMRYIAQAYRAKGDDRTAETWYARAAAEAPHLREPYMDWARMLYSLEDWEGVAFLTGRALAITRRERTYITEGAAWGSEPWDLRAIALYRLGRLREALTAAERACELSPGDERLRNNAALIRREAI
ncbi:MAG: tetratricopeptide repeat protein [Clostridia bacterium]|nr:tetratricopeptide repeat protein [Clostridia bacterium]